MYHYVREFDPEIPKLHFLHIDDFKRQLDFLDRKYGFLSREEFLNSFINPNSLKPGVVMTFDDGLIDHYHYVFPELVSRGLWGIFYIPGSILKTERILTVHKIHILLARYESKKILEEINSIIEPSMIDEAMDKEHADKIYLKQESINGDLEIKRLFNYSIKNKFKDELADKLFAQFISDEYAFFKRTYMIDRHLKEMSDEGMIIGSHAMNHHPMVNLSKEDQKNEIIESFRLISSCFSGLNPKTFCYPQGLPHTFDEDTEHLLKERNTLFSFAVESRDIASSDLSYNEQKLPRYDCNEFKYGKSFITK